MATDSTNDPQPDDLAAGPAPLVEEAWESEIENLLASLPLVDPPEGFLQAALDHRPLYAGRSLVVAGLASVLLLAGFSAVGLFAKETFVPDLDGLVSRHSATQAGVLGLRAPLDEGDHVFELIEDSEKAKPAPVALIGGFEWEADFGSRDHHQGVFADQDHVVSIFEEPGQIAFDELAAEGLMEIDGVLAWSDPSRDLVMVQAQDSVVTLVGLSDDHLSDVVAQIDSAEKSGLDLFFGRVNRATRQLGFPDLK